jgi:hypothetical protein
MLGRILFKSLFIRGRSPENMKIVAPKIRSSGGSNMEIFLKIAQVIMITFQKIVQIISSNRTTQMVSFRKIRTCPLAVQTCLRESAVASLVEELCYKPEGRRFDSR